MKYIVKLREEEQRELAYHLEGLLDAASYVRGMVSALGDNACSPLTETADALTELQVEIFDHLLYHIRGLREPMSVYAKALYSKIGDD
jgi:hypothetical protein